MTEDPPLVVALRAIARAEGRYTLDAYLFLYQSLERAQQLVGDKRHVSGQELLEGFRLLAGELFGPLALTVLNAWGLRETRDVGAMVFDLVEHELMGKTEDDCIEDFEDVFEFADAFAPEKLLADLDLGRLTPTIGLVRRELPGAARPTAAKA